ncbi:chaperonin GroEL [Halalkalibacterium ligniniphilum]|uniref:chaperonin GroEL n=1 Tax=Halalkalibacterium ligniniphilum TaxID=1134413 RepID=UPI00034B152D|nr:chaperonin GroEL [Halalkalibacterium ligniniphilum]
MPKLIKLDGDAHAALERGVDKLATIIKATLGPKGRNAIIDRPFATPMISNDGAFIASELELEDSFENMGAVLVREVASTTNEMAGDGTTTATILAQAMIKKGLGFIREGANPMTLKKGIEKSIQEVVKKLKDKAIPIETNQLIAEVASISSKDREIGNLIAKAIERVGRDGIVTVEDSKLPITELDIVEGMQFERGYISHNMVTDFDRMKAILDEPYILVTDQKIDKIQQIVPIMNQLLKDGKPLLIIAEDVGNDVLGTIIMNQNRGNLQTVAVRAPEFGPFRQLALEDIAVMTGAQLISGEMGRNLESMSVEDLGRARQVRVSKNETEIIQGYGDQEQIRMRKEHVRMQIEDIAQEWEKEKLQERLSNLSEGVAVIYVGGSTAVERRERLLRIEDALNATQAAIEQGIVAGGGTALLHASPILENLVEQLTGDEQLGAKVVLHALSAPLETIAENSGVDPLEVVETVKSLPIGHGFDALTEEYVNLIENGIIDPVKVSCSALENAASIASLIITTKTLITDKPEIDDPTSGPSHGGGAEIYE